MITKIESIAHMANLVYGCAASRLLALNPIVGLRTFLLLEDNVEPLLCSSFKLQYLYDEEQASNPTDNQYFETFKLYTTLDLEVLTESDYYIGDKKFLIDPNSKDTVYLKTLIMQSRNDKEQVSYSEFIEFIKLCQIKYIELCSN